MKRLTKVVNWFKTNPDKVQATPELFSVTEPDDFDSVITNSYNTYKSENDSEGKRVWSHENTKIEINRLNRNAFEHHFYHEAFRYQFSQLKLDIATIADKAKSAPFMDQREEAKEHFEIAMAYLEDTRKKFIFAAPEKFPEESKIMIKSMISKELTAESIEDLQNYFSLEWSQRRDIRYKSIINYLLLTEKKLRDDLIKLGVFERKENPPIAAGAAGKSESDKKPHLNF